MLTNPLGRLEGMVGKFTLSMVCRDYDFKPLPSLNYNNLILL